MDLGVTLQLALRSLLRNKVRTALTMLGVVIGIASVIAMVALGQGASTMIQRQMDSMGKNLLTLIAGAASSGGSSWGAATMTTLTPDDGAAIVKEVPSVEAATPLFRVRTQIVYGNRNWVPDRILGVGTAFLDVRAWALDEGAFIAEQDVGSAAKICVLGATVVENLFQGEPPLQAVVRVKNVPLKVVGILARKGTDGTGHDQDDIVVVPWTTAKRGIEGSAFNNVDQILVTAVSAPAMAAAKRDITALLRQRHRLRGNEESDFRILTMTEMTAAATQSSRIMTLLLAIIASISLVVGGVGIMNIMLVSVVERTREIGVRMAIGARGRDILLQFLAEAVVIALIAGLAGMLLGALTAVILSRTLDWPTQISLASVEVALLFSCGVGVFFGFYPALRASRLDPIEALRYE